MSRALLYSLISSGVIPYMIAYAALGIGGALLAARSIRSMVDDL